MTAARRASPGLDPSLKPRPFAEYPGNIIGLQNIAIADENLKIADVVMTNQMSDIARTFFFKIIR